MKKNIGILWDLDGTILDSCELYYKSSFPVFEKYHLENSSFEFYKANVFGRSFDGWMHVLMGNQYNPEIGIPAAQELSDAGLAYLKACDPSELKFIPGVLRVLHGLHDAGCPMAVASSSNLNFIIEAVSKLGIVDLFTNIISGKMLPTKPAPDVFRVAADSLRVPYGDCVVFEDSRFGMEAAKAAGMKCVGIATGMPVEKMENVDIPLRSYDELDLQNVFDLF